MASTRPSSSQGFVQKPPGIDHRAHIRCCLHRLSYFSLVAGPRRQTLAQATVRDISAGGIGLSIGRRLEPGTLRSLDLDGVCRLLLGRVMRVSLETDGNWRIGWRFLARLSPEELQAVLGDGQFPRHCASLPSFRTVAVPGPTWRT
jgi:hypothetical protein